MANILLEQRNVSGGVGVVDAHPPCEVFLYDHDWVCQPVRVVHLHDETGFQQPGNFFSYCSSFLLPETAEGLPNWLSIRLHMKRVLSELPRLTRHVFGRPREDVPILTEEFDELAFLFVAEGVADGVKTSMSHPLVP